MSTSPTANLTVGIGVDTGGAVSVSITLTSQPFTSTTKSTMTTDYTTTTLPIPTSLPTNGFGGLWYSINFSVPTYSHDSSPTVMNTTSWAAIDQFAQKTAGVASVSGIALGLCLATLVYVIALTPDPKRSRPFHILLLLALLSEIARLLFDVVRISDPRVSPYSAYLSLTEDLSSTYWSSEYINLDIAKQSAAIFAYVFTVGCLSIQASGLLSNVRLNHARVHWTTMAILVCASVTALTFHIIYTITQIWRLKGKETSLSFNDLSVGTLMAYATSLAGWCLVSLMSAIYLLYSRLRLNIAVNQLYRNALAVLAMIAFESFVVPLTLCTISVSPADLNVHVDDLIIPTVLILLPLSSIFTSVHAASLKDATETSPKRKPKEDSPGALSTRNLIDTGTNTTIIMGPTDVPEPPDPYKETYKMTELTPKPSNNEPLRDPIDRELRDIDNMVAEASSRRSHDSDELVIGCAPDGDVLKQRARRVIRNLATRSVTPQSSQINIV